MVKLLCIVEVNDARTEDRAQRVLDAFRETVRPSDTYGLTIYRATADDLRGGLADLHVVAVPAGEAQS